MKAVPGPVSATKASAQTRSPCIPSSTSPPNVNAFARHVAVAAGSRPHQHLTCAVPAYGPRRGTIPATHANLRAVQHTRRTSGSGRTWPFDAKVTKPTHRGKVGLWLESVDAGSRPHPPPSATYMCPEPKWKPCPSSSMSSDTTQTTRNLASPRIPLADITPFVLAADSTSNFYFSEMADSVSPPQQRSPCLATDITGAINMLTADEARRLLLLSAQSNISLATTIREIAFARTSNRSAARVERVQSDLADTFIFDEDQTLPDA